MKTIFTHCGWIICIHVQSAKSEFAPKGHDKCNAEISRSNERWQPNMKIELRKDANKTSMRKLSQRGEKGGEERLAEGSKFLLRTRDKGKASGDPSSGAKHFLLFKLLPQIRWGIDFLVQESPRFSLQNCILSSSHRAEFSKSVRYDICNQTTLRFNLESDKLFWE